MNDNGETVDAFGGYCSAGSFDITDACKPGETHQIAVFGSRPPGWINELGTGGLMGPVLLYRER